MSNLFQMNPKYLEIFEKMPNEIRLNALENIKGLIDCLNGQVTVWNKTNTRELKIKEKAMVGWDEELRERILKRLEDAGIPSSRKVDLVQFASFLFQVATYRKLPITKFDRGHSRNKDGILKWIDSNWKTIEKLLQNAVLVTRDPKENEDFNQKDQ